jgi:hypothetical protein
MNQTDLDPDLDSGSKLGTATKAKDKAAPVGERKARIDAILKGGIDPHVHSGPSIAPRSLDHLELVRQMSEAEFAAVVTKDHDYAGVATAALIQKHHPELRTKIFSGIVLNNVVGGINPYAVEHTAAMGGKIVWMPTLAAENHLRWEKTANFAHPASTQKMRPASPVPVAVSALTTAGHRVEVSDLYAEGFNPVAGRHDFKNATLNTTPLRLFKHHLGLADVQMPARQDHLRLCNDVQHFLYGIEDLFVRAPFSRSRRAEQSEGFRPTEATARCATSSIPFSAACSSTWASKHWSHLSPTLHLGSIRRCEPNTCATSKRGFSRPRVMRNGRSGCAFLPRLQPRTDSRWARTLGRRDASTTLADYSRPGIPESDFQ